MDLMLGRFLFSFSLYHCVCFVVAYIYIPGKKGMDPLGIVDINYHSGRVKYGIEILINQSVLVRCRC